MSKKEEEGEYRMLKNMLSICAYVHENELRVDFDGPLGPIIQRLFRKFIKDVLTWCNDRRNILSVQNGRFVYSLDLPPVPSEACIKASLSIFRSHVLRQRVPNAATIELTSNCQCRCVHCSAALFKKPEGKELTASEVKRVIDQCLDQLGITNITFTGGEPLLRPDIFELIEHVNPKEAITSIFTNGFLLGEDMVQRLKDAGLYSLLVSIDSPNPEEHDRLRGLEGCFEHAVQGIQNGLRAGLLVGIATYATHENVKNGKLEETIFLARKLGVHEVIVFNVVPTGRLLHNKDVILTPEENELVWDLFVKYNEVAPPKIYNIRKSLKIGCFGARHTLHVTSYGHVTPCPFAPISFGNVRRETIKEIWRRMGESKSFKGRQDACRMQDPSFRAKYISRIPEGAFLPYPIEKIEYK